MKKIIGLILLLNFSLIISSSAQSLHGGFGNFFIGQVYNLSPSLEKSLKADNLLGSNLHLNVNTLFYGGAGYTLRPRGFILGGNGYSYHVTSTVEKGEATLVVSGGFFNVGYCLLNTKKWIGFPYFGVGGFGTNFKISNSTSGEKMVIGDDIISAGETAKYSTGGMAFELGFGLKYFGIDLRKKNDGKSTVIVIGVDAGSSFFPAFQKWENVETHGTVNSMNQPFIMSPYIRFTIGLGVFNENKSK